MNLPNDFPALSSETGRTSIIRKKQKEFTCLSCLMKKSLLPSWDSNPELSRFLLSNSAKLFSQLDKCHSSWYIYTKTWKGQLQAVTMAVRPVATSSVYAISHFKWFHVQDTESYVIGCEFLKFYHLWSLCDCPMRKIHCDKADFTKNCGTTYKAYALP